MRYRVTVGAGGVGQAAETPGEMTSPRSRFHSFLGSASSATAAGSVRARAAGPAPSAMVEEVS
jgi:hypothetical protein